MLKTRTLTIIAAVAFAASIMPNVSSADGPTQFALLGFNGSVGNVGFFEWGPDGFNFTGASGSSSTIPSYGMSVGDVDGDTLDEALFVRGTATNNQCVEIWKYNTATQAYGQVWKGACANTNLGSVGGVGDFDRDGKPEFLRTTGTAQQIWGYDDGDLQWTLETDVTPVGCGGTNPVRFVRAAGDMNGDGTPEFLASCASGSQSRRSSVVQVREWDGTTYAVRASWSIPFSTYYMDDSDCRGDMNGDGLPECVFSGNDDRMSHVISYQNGSWRIVFDSPVAPSYVASCKMGDFDGDGLMEYFDYAETSAAGGTRKNPIPANIHVALRFFKFNPSTSKVEWWQSLPNLNAIAHMVSSTMSGDIDNDGIDEIGLVTGLSAPLGYSILRFDSTGKVWNTVDVFSPVSGSGSTGRVGRLR